MITDPIQADDIRYNAASSSFEAKVTVHGAGPARVYACEIEGDLSLTKTDIVQALQADAMRRHKGRLGLCSSRHLGELHPQHTPQRATTPKGWFDRFPAVVQLRAA